jgi:Uma2 family endonuclease
MSIAADSAAIAFANNPPLPVAFADRSFTPDELLALPDEGLFELVDGRLVERHMGSLSGRVATRIATRLDVFAEANDLGEVNSGAGFRFLADSPNTVRKPDVAFVKRGRLQNETHADGYDSLAPDLAVEVISPNDLAIEVELKRQEYVRAGVRLIWIVTPETKTIHIYRADGTTSLLNAEDELTGEDVIPGFRCRVAELFGKTAGKP